jgi:hypothetical protein
MLVMSYEHSRPTRPVEGMVQGQALGKSGAIGRRGIEVVTTGLGERNQVGIHDITSITRTIPSTGRVGLLCSYRSTQTPLAVSPS